MGNKHGKSTEYNIEEENKSINKENIIEIFSIISLLIGLFLIGFTVYLILFKNFKGNDLSNLYFIIGILFLFGFLGSDLLSIFKGVIKEKVDTYFKDNPSFLQEKIDETVGKILQNFQKNQESHIEKLIEKNTQVEIEENEINNLKNILDEEKRSLLDIIIKIQKSINDKKISLFRRGNSKAFGLTHNEIGQFITIENNIAIKVGSSIKVTENDRDSEKVQNRMNDEFKNYLEDNGLQYFIKKFQLSYYGYSSKTVKDYRWIENKVKIEELLKDKNELENNLKKVITDIILEAS